MKKNGVYKDSQGYEYFMFPMGVFRCTQGYANDVLWVSHERTKAIDITGTHANFPLFMPCTVKCIGKFDHGKGNGVLWESVDKVHLANGQIDKVHFVFWHDNNISDFAVGSVWKQGQECQDTGHNGIGSGDHCHFEVGIGNAPKGYPLVNAGGWTHFDYGKNIPTYTLKNAIRPEDACFIDDTRIISNPWNMKFKKIGDSMKDGWIWDENLKEQTYYEKGVMQRNKWVQDVDGQWYWLKNDGRMARKEVIMVNGYQRCFWDSGACADKSNTHLNEDGTYQKK